MKVMLGNGFSVVSAVAAEVSMPGIAWRPMIGEHSTIPIKAIWLESNPKPALHHLVKAGAQYAR